VSMSVPNQQQPPICGNGVGEARETEKDATDWTQLTSCVFWFPVWLSLPSWKLRRCCSSRNSGHSLHSLQGVTTHITLSTIIAARTWNATPCWHQINMYEFPHCSHAAPWL
jgi:hypothetical protein